MTTLESSGGTAHGGHTHHEDPGELVAFDQYRGHVLDHFAPLGAQTVDLLDAHGCALAEDVAAEAAIPAFANSAMDGFAVRAQDAVEGARLRLVGEIAAGSGEFPPVGAGEAVRIMTGAALPPGADAVVPVEAAEEDDGGVVVGHAAAPGANVRPAGEDVAAGDRVLSAGRRLAGPDIGMLAALGRATVRVRRRPRVAVMSTGDELVEPGTPLRPGQIHDANSFTLTTMAREAGASPARYPIVADDPDALRHAFTTALADADLLVTSAGVSAGRYDHVKKILAELGDVAFRKIAMKPGMPQAFGVLAADSGPGVPCFGLPGNPVSAAVTFEVLVRPALARLQGTDLERTRITAVASEAFSSPEHKIEFVRVVLAADDHGVWHARPTGAQGSGILRSMVDADGLAEVTAGRGHVAAGETLTVRLLRP